MFVGGACGAWLPSACFSVPSKLSGYLCLGRLKSCGVTRSLSLSLSLSLSPSLSPCLSLSLSLSLSLCLSLSDTVCLTRFSLSFSRSLLMFSLICTHKHTLPLTFSHTLSPSRARCLSHTHMYEYTQRNQGNHTQRNQSGIWCLELERDLLWPAAQEPAWNRGHLAGCFTGWLPG